ncbi:MAG: TIGR00725 family protein [Deltaproteobacteria bacterium]|nr:TIGR00725 family protein [Deltaproteobacteria bacterium]
MVSYHKPVIAVVGSSAPSPLTRQLAFEVGREAVRAGFSIVSGGLGGIMEAASQGAQAAKDELRRSGSDVDLPQVIAVLPVAEKQRATPFADIVLPTGLGYARNAVVVLAGDGVIALEGGSGTLSEIAYAWQFGKPVAALAPSGGWAARLAGTSLDGKRGDSVYRAESAAAAVEFIAGQLAGNKP